MHLNQFYEVDETKAYYTEWSKSERKTSIQYINAYIWNLERWYDDSIQQKRHRYKEQTFGLCGRRWGWDDLREQHWNMYITMCETDCQSKFNAWNRALKASAPGQPKGMGWGGRWERCSGWGTHVHPWLIHVNVWLKPPQYCKVINLQLKSIN